MKPAVEAKRWRQQSQNELAEREQRVHLAIGPCCNNNCIFCMEEDRAGRKRINGALTPRHVGEILENNRHAREVCFTSGEPTLVRELPRYVARARALGYSRVSISTNGRRLAYRHYCDELVAAGANLFYISVHGHTAKLHDGLTRTPGAFEQTVSGLRNTVRHGRGGAVEVHTCTVVNKRNLEHIGDIYRFLRDEGADQIVFNVMQANGRAHTHFERLFPRYTEIAAGFRRFLDGLPETSPPVYLVDIPLCVTEKIPDPNRGWVESYIHHEASGARGDDPPPDEPRSPAGSAGPFLLERSRAGLDRERRGKRGECSTCVHDRICAGVWKNYLSRFGWEEFCPVTRDGSGPVTEGEL